MHVDLVSLGALVLVAGLAARLGRRVGLPSIPLYMLVGIVFGPSLPGLTLIEHPEDLALLAVLGLVLLLFHIGVDFPAEQVLRSGRRLFMAAGFGIASNGVAGLLLGFVFDFTLAEAIVLAGILGISSSAIVTKLLIELRRLTNAETPVILGIIVIEDLYLALYAALLTPILSGASTPLAVARDIAVAFGFILLLFAVVRYGARVVGALIGSREQELLVVVVVGVVLLVAGLSEEVGASDAIGALMIGLVISRTRFRSQVEQAILPLRDLFAAVFFVAFGLSIDLGALGEVVLPAVIAVLLTLMCNVVLGILTARLFQLNQRSAANVAFAVLSRGEFALILATIAAAAGLDARIGPFVALYVLVLALLSPLLSANSHHLARAIPDRLMRSRWTYVRHETMSTSCTHLDQVQITESDATVCPTCVAVGDTWVHLRMCASCGAVGCCDDSPNRHARAHFTQTGHPVVVSIEPGESWRYCFVDQTLVQAPVGS